MRRSVGDAGPPRPCSSNLPSHLEMVKNRQREVRSGPALLRTIYPLGEQTTPLACSHPHGTLDDKDDKRVNLVKDGASWISGYSPPCGR